MLLASALRAVLVAVLASLALAGCASCGQRLGPSRQHSVRRRCPLRRAPRSALRHAPLAAPVRAAPPSPSAACRARLPAAPPAPPAAHSPRRLHHAGSSGVDSPNLDAADSAVPTAGAALVLTPDASSMQTSRWLPMAAIGRLCHRPCTLVSAPVRSWHAGKSCHRSVARTTDRNPEICAVFQCVVDLSTDCHRLVFRPRLWYFLRATDRWHGQRHHMTATRRRRPSHSPFAPRAVYGPCGPRGA